MQLIPHMNQRLASKGLVWASVLAIALIASCGDDQDVNQQPGTAVPTAQPSPPPGTPSGAYVQVGSWGGDSSTLNVIDSGATYRKGCTTGSVGPLATNTAGEFSANGTLIEPGLGQVNANYAGKVTGQVMSLTVTYTGRDGTPVKYEDDLTYGFEGPLPATC